MDKSLPNFRSAFGGYTEIKIVVAAGIIEIQPFFIILHIYYTIFEAAATIKINTVSIATINQMVRAIDDFITPLYTI